MPVSKMAVAAMAGTALANNLATIAPCTQKPGLYPDQIVSSQFQEVSYCVPTPTVEYSTSTSVVGYGTTSTITHTISTTAYPLASTSVYVSTVIPCAYDGAKAQSSCTVTTTDQTVECRETSTTITSYKPYETTYVVPVTQAPGMYGYSNQTYGNATTSYETKTTTSTETHYTTVSKQYDAPYNSIGNWIIPGYDGTPICKDCGEDSAGVKHQGLDVKDCSKVDSGSYTCSNYKETWTSKAAPSSTSVYSSAVTTHATAPSAGTYSYSFKQTAPAATYTAPASGSHPSSVITAPAQTWYETVTKSCSGPTTWDITTTITKTVTYTCPYEHSTPGGQHPTTYTTAQPTGGYSTGSAYPTGSHTTGGSAYPTGGNPTSGSSYPTGGSPTSGSTYPTTSCPGDFKLAVVDTNARFQKAKFVGFDGDDATVADGASCAVFVFDGEQNLATGSDYVQTSGSSQYAPFEKSASKPSSYNKYSFDAAGNLKLAGAQGFCQKDDAIFVVYGSAPYGCANVNLQKRDVPHAGCSTTTYGPTSTTMSTSSTTSETSTYSTPDVSGDVDYEPTPAPTATYYRKRSLIHQ